MLSPTEERSLRDLADRLNQRIVTRESRTADLHPVHHEHTKAVITQLYARCRRRPPSIVWCHSPVVALAVIAFFRSIALTYSSRRLRWNALWNPVIDTCVEPTARWFSSLLRYCSDEDMSWSEARAQAEFELPCHESPDFLNLWLGLPEAMRFEVWETLSDSLLALGLQPDDRDIPLLHEFLRNVTAESIEAMRKQHWDRLPDDDGEDGLLRVQRTWTRLRIVFRSKLHPARWKGFGNRLEREQRRLADSTLHAFLQSQPEYRSRGRACRREMRRALLELLSDHVQPRMQHHMSGHLLHVLRVQHPTPFEIWDTADRYAFERSLLTAVILDALYDEISALPDSSRSAIAGVPWAETWFFPHRRICWISERPAVYCTDDRGWLHCEDGPALAYPGGGGEIYAWHGIHVAGRVILRPDAITREEIEHEFNTELRYVLLQRYGVDRYLLDSAAQAIHRDARGVLWKIEYTGYGRREPLLLVEVQNASPEPDGSRRRFFLRVPPSMQTAHEAVAWTFGKSEIEYAPIEET